MFIGFSNFYQRFIYNFNKIATLLTLILKITKLFKKSFFKAFKAENNKVVDDSKKPDKMVINLFNKLKKTSVKIQHIYRILGLKKNLTF